MRIFQKLSFIFSLFLFSIIFMLPMHAHADQVGNIFGTAWGADNGGATGQIGGIGEIFFSEQGSVDPGNPSYLTINDDGTVTGKAWSPNYGWIRFDAGCPSSASGVCSATFIDANNPSDTNIQNKTSLVGWARVCSVYASSDLCSGLLKSNNYRGGWDGWISLSSKFNALASVGTPSYGVVRNGQVLSGYAWGSDNVGWIAFGNTAGNGSSALALLPSPTPSVATLTSPDQCTAGANFALDWSVNSTYFADYTCTGTSSGDPAPWLPANTPAVSSTAPARVTTTASPNETFTLRCTSNFSGDQTPISTTFTAKAACTGSSVLGVPRLKIGQDSAWPKKDATGNNCVDPNDVYGPQVTLDLTSLGSTNEAVATARCDTNWGTDIGFRGNGIGAPCLNRNATPPYTTGKDSPDGASAGPYTVFSDNTTYHGLWYDPHIKEPLAICAKEGLSCSPAVPVTENFVYGIPGVMSGPGSPVVRQQTTPFVCSAGNFGTSSPGLPNVGCYYDPYTPVGTTPALTGIILNGKDQITNTPFSEDFPPTDATNPKVTDVDKFAETRNFANNNSDSGWGWNTVDFLYPKEGYFDINRCSSYYPNGRYTNYPSGLISKTYYANGVWTIDHPSDPITNDVSFLDQGNNNFIFKLNDSLSSAYPATAHNDPSIGPHQQCIVYPRGKNGYFSNFSYLNPLWTPIYAKPIAPYDSTSAGYCPITVTIDPAPDLSCQLYTQSFPVTWNVPGNSLPDYNGATGHNATACTAKATCVDAAGNPNACTTTGWDWTKTGTALIGPHTETVTVTPSPLEDVTATLSLDCNYPVTTDANGNSIGSGNDTLVSAAVPVSQLCEAPSICGNGQPIDAPRGTPEYDEQCDMGSGNTSTCTPDATGSCKYCGDNSVPANACKIVTITNPTVDIYATRSSNATPKTAGQGATYTIANSTNNPLTLASGDSSYTINWVVANANSCTLQYTDGPLSGNSAWVSAGGFILNTLSDIFPALSANANLRTYKIDCSGANVTVTDMITIGPYTYCGDGFIENPDTNGIHEICDNGAANIDNGPAGSCIKTGPNACTIQQPPKTFCGDGIQQDPNDDGFNEQCDSTNRSICTASCTIPLSVVAGPLTVAPICIVSGDGTKPIATWTSQFADSCTANANANSVGFNTGGATSGTSILFPGFNNREPIFFGDPNKLIPPGTYTISMHCDNGGNPDTVVSAPFVVNNFGVSCTGSKYQPIYIES